MSDMRSIDERVSVIVPVVDQAEAIGALLQRLREQIQPPSEIIVVDGGSHDGTPEIVARWGRWWPVVKLQTHRSGYPGKNRNRGAARASGDLLAFIDGDTLPDLNWLGNLLSPFRDHPDCDVVMGSCVSADSTLCQRVMGYLLLGRARKTAAGYRYVPTSASLAVRASAWHRLGGFAEDLRASEESDLYLRIEPTGLATRLAPDATVVWTPCRDWCDGFRKGFRYGYWGGIAGKHAAERLPALLLNAVLVGSLALGFIWPVLWLGTAAVACAYAIWLLLYNPDHARFWLARPHLYVVLTLTGLVLQWVLLCAWCAGYLSFVRRFRRIPLAGMLSELKRAVLRRLKPVHLWTRLTPVRYCRPILAVQASAERLMASLRIQGLGQSGPEVLIIETINVCNARCIICPYTAMTRKKELMSLVLYERIVRMCREAGVRRIQLNGTNEPLLDPHLFERIRLAKEAGIAEITIFSNASRLNHKATEQLLNSGLDLVVVSMDGTNKDTFEGVRVGLKWEHVSANLFNFLERRRERGLRKPLVVVSIISLEDRTLKQAASSEIVRRLEGLADSVDLLPPLDVHTWAEQNAPVGRRARRARHPPCRRLWRSMSVLPDGQVALCCLDFDGVVSFGNLARQHLMEVWNGAPLQRVRERHRRGNLSGVPLCQSCDERPSWYPKHHERLLDRFRHL